MHAHIHIHSVRTHTHTHTHTQTKIRDMAAGKSKDKDKEGKRERGWSTKTSGGQFIPPMDDTDTPEASLVAILADQVVREEKRKLKPGLRQKKKGKQKKKISKWWDLKLYAFSPSLPPLPPSLPLSVLFASKLITSY